MKKGRKEINGEKFLNVIKKSGYKNAHICDIMGRGHSWVTNTARVSTIAEEDIPKFCALLGVDERDFVDVDETSEPTGLIEHLERIEQILIGIKNNQISEMNLINVKAEKILEEVRRCSEN